MHARVGDEWATEDGFSMVEVLVAVAMLLVVAGGMLNAMVGSVTSVRGSRDRQAAVALANEVIERARTLDIDVLAMRNGAHVPPCQCYDPDGAGPLPSETIERSSTGAVTGAPYHQTVDGFDVETYVTWYDDTVVAGDENALRVTTTVSWDHADGDSESVRISTVVADVDRGSP